MNRVVGPLLDLPVLDEKHPDAFPGEGLEILPASRSEAVDPVIDHDRSHSERVQNLEFHLTVSINKGCDCRAQSFPAAYWRSRFRHAIDAIVGEKPDNPRDVARRYRSTEVSDELDIGLLGTGPLRGICCAGGSHHSSCPQPTVERKARRAIASDFMTTF